MYQMSTILFIAWDFFEGSASTISLPKHTGVSNVGSQTNPPQNDPKPLPPPTGLRVTGFHVEDGVVPDHDLRRPQTASPGSRARQPPGANGFGARGFSWPGTRVPKKTDLQKIENICQDIFEGDSYNLYIDLLGVTDRSGATDRRWACIKGT